MANLQKLLTQEIAALLGVNRRSISRWVRDEKMPQNPDKTFDGARCVQWLTERLETRNAAECDRPIPGEQWLHEFRRVQFLRAELQLKLEQGELMPESEVIDQWVARVREVTSGLETFADRMPPLVVGRNRDEIRAILKAEIGELRNAYARNGKYTPEVLDDSQTES